MEFRPVAMAVALTACGSSPSADSIDLEGLTPPTATQRADAPETREAFLQELAPLPYASVRIEYEVTGPGGMQGLLEVLAVAGGFRRESWELQLPTPNGTPMQIRGSSLQTPDRAWTDAVDGAAVVRRLPLGPIADAYTRLPVARRTEVVRHVRTFHGEIESGRASHPGTQKTIAGHDCLVTQVAGHALCVWEETGLPLHYEGTTFNVLASTVTTDAPVPPGSFLLPAGGRRATDDALGFDPDKSVQRLAQGDVAELASLLQPGLRLSSI